MFFLGLASAVKCFIMPLAVNQVALVELLRVMFILMSALSIPMRFTLLAELLLVAAFPAMALWFDADPLVLLYSIYVAGMGALVTTVCRSAEKEARLRFFLNPASHVRDPATAAGGGRNRGSSNAGAELAADIDDASDSDAIGAQMAAPPTLGRAQSSMTAVVTHMRRMSTQAPHMMVQILPGTPDDEHERAEEGI
jgi:hypothetical protein